MEYDAFDAGVDMDGLRVKNDIKILVCYILKSVNAPLSKGDLTKIMMEKGLANYFEIQEAIASLTKMNNISMDGDELCTINEQGIEIANQLDKILPFTVREKVTEAAFNLLAEAKIKKENKVEIEMTKNGYDVTCHISGGDFDLFKFTLYAPDMLQATLIKENFYKDPESIYKLFLCWLTDVDVI